MEPIFFSSSMDFRAWLEENHKSAEELIVGFWKVDSGRPSMKWSESVDQALCFGWIDGVRRKIDDKSYSIRFTPRRPNSVWSAINIKKVEELKARGLMREAGTAAFERRREDRSVIYSYENEPQEFGAVFEQVFKESSRGWDFFQAQAPWYKRQMTSWVVSAKQESTRQKRLAKLIEACEEGRRI
jgi:uncharacterized protein YdeI (YjbR/CyaY-like superfamily)